MPAFLTVFFLAGLPLTAELGGWLHVLANRGRPRDPSGAGFLSASALGLLGLLVAFTFSMASERFEARRQLVVQEANGLSTVYLRDQLLGAPSDARLQPLIARYAQARLAFFDAGEDAGRLDAAGKATTALQNAIWRETSQALAKPANGPLATVVLSSTNDLFDLASTREAARESTVPLAVIWAVTLCAFATAALCGYGLEAGGHRHRVAATSLFLLIAIALLLIHDLNTPRGGFIRSPQGPLVREVADLRAREAARLAASAMQPAP